MSGKKLSVSQNALYNMIGAFVFCFCQWVTSGVLVYRLSPTEIAANNAGLLQLAITTTNIFFAISCYNMRTYQISDTKNEYSYGDYTGVRIVTSVIAVVLCVVYVIAWGFSFKAIVCTVLYMFFKLNETFSDVLHGIDQKNYRMDYICVSLCIRGISSVIVFVIAIMLFDDILIAVALMALVCSLEVFAYDIKVTKQFGSIKPIFNTRTIIKLLIVCMPAVISSAAFTAITSIPRQTLASMRSEESLGYYGTIATPLLVVQILATSIFNPMLTELSELYSKGEVVAFAKRIAKNLCLLFCISAAVCVGVVLLGDFAVGLVFGKELVPYTYLMYGIIGCTTMYVISWLCTNTLIIMRKLNICMIASLIALGVSSLLAKPLINLFEMNGVSISIIIAYAIHISVCFIIICRNLILKKRGNMKYFASDHTYALCAYKESAYLEECVKSLLAQTVKSTIFIATSTPNDHIDAVAKKYDIPVFVNEGEKGIGGDWNFAYDKAQTPLVTIAHQDDIYEPTYTEKMLEYLNEANNPIIYFCGYGELRNDKKVYDNTNLTIKKILLSPLKIKAFWKSRFVRRRILSIGNSICCPAVTYVTERVGQKPFTNDYLSNIDWQQWELLSRKKGSFVYNNLPLMCHRIHDESTTTEIIGDSKRSKEDFDMFCKFWPRPVAKLIAKVYSGSEKSNNV